METLPFELLEQIAAFACTDGGRTGCSLSLVSKRFREVARGTRFASVALTSGHPSQLAQFLAAYTTARDARPEHGAMPRIRHLCVCSDASRRHSNMRSGHGRPTTPPLGESTRRFEFTAVLEQLLRTVAPELESLALVSTRLAYPGFLPVPASLLEKNVWPELRELTIVGSASTLVPPSDLGSNTTGPAAARSPLPPASTTTPAASQSRLERGRRGVPLTSASPRLPRLTHLHLVTIGVGVVTQPLHLAQWSVCVPCLTHLRVSGPDTMREFAEELQRAVCGSRSTSTSGDTDLVDAPPPLLSPPTPSQLFPRLTHLAIQPYRLRAGKGTHEHAVASGAQVQAALKTVQLAFKEVLEHASESPGALKVEVQPTVGVLHVSELGQLAVREWVGGGFVRWAGRDENLG
ncbi:hypothetical protein C8Q76DRAFT_321669 [Earliella scabrosa]|nr:hypothetical protein C8Q76DRAFT_321669 [Earliella scabrosa]